MIKKLTKDLKDKDKFLASVTDNLVKKGPFTLASILANIYQPRPRFRGASIMHNQRKCFQRQ